MPGTSTERVQLAEHLLACSLCAAYLKENISVITDGGTLTERDVPDVLRCIQLKHEEHRR